MSASQKWDLLKGTLKSAAETTIGRSVPRHKNPHCQDMAALSETQRKLRLQINNTRNPARKQELKQQRNRILHAQRRRARDNASVRLDHLASEVERLHDGAKMFRAVQEMTRKPASKLRIQDDSGRVICNAAELNERVTHHFGQQFNDPRVMELPAFTGVPSPLTMPITPGEVQRAISKLNSGRACGHDDLPADLLKSTADLIAPATAEIFNDALDHHEPLDIGKGVLILLQKPGKPVGPLTSVRPIVLLSALRKTLSLVVLSRIATKVDNFLSPSQSGFRRGPSTADVVFGYRWLCAKAQRQRMTIEFLCIDLSLAFDTICRDKLLEVLQSFLDEPELRMIRFLLAATSLEPRLSTGECHAFASTIGTPQGDSLSPVLFTVYLEAALRDRRSRLPPRPPADAKLPPDVEYADDFDFISYSRPYLNEIERIAPVCLGEWSLQINAAKTERTSVSRQVDQTHEPWRTTRKLGSLLGEVEDVTRRMQLATLECLINVPVRVFISRKMPPYTGLIWHYTFIKKKKNFTFKYISLHILATQFLRNTTNSSDLVVNKSWYLYNLSLGRLLEGDPLKCCLLIQAADTGSDCASSHFAYNLWDLPPYTLIWHYTIIKFVRFATLYSYLALYVY